MTDSSLATTNNGVCQDEGEELLWEEFEIDIDWGILRGKKRGNGVKKVLAVHGWLDNADSFDRVYPFLREEFTFLSLDLPGHGKSGHFNPGFTYDPRGYVGAIKKAVMKLGWDKFIYLGHSMGALAGIIYTATFPEDIECLISIDIIKPWSFTPEAYAAGYKKYFLDLFKQEDLYSKPPLEYDEVELVDRVMAASKSLDRTSAEHLMKRGTKSSECGSKKILTRDMRAKAFFIGFIPFDAWLEFARSITCPTLIIKAKQGHLYETPERYQDVLDAFEENCRLYKFEDLDGKHHLHLTHAKIVGPKIADFISKSLILLDDTKS